MLKIIGAAVVILSATFYGMGKYFSFFERKKALAEILDGARRISSKISVLNAPLHELFQGCGAFFEKASEGILSGTLPEEAVNSVALSEYALKKDDRRIIERFASGLCATSCEEQKSNLSVFIDELEKSLAKASAELDGKGVLCVKGSILAAAATVLLLI